MRGWGLGTRLSSGVDRKGLVNNQQLAWLHSISILQALFQNLNTIGQSLLQISKFDLLLYIQTNLYDIMTKYFLPITNLVGQRGIISIINTEVGMQP